jgi:hypothetical protein
LAYSLKDFIRQVYCLPEANAMAEAANVAPANANGEEGDQGRDRIE